MPILANLKRPSSHPFSPADAIHAKYQAVDDAAAMTEMCRDVRTLDRQDGRQAFGNGPHSPAIREAAIILRENLHSGDVSKETKIMILKQCVPMIFSVVSGQFPDVFKSLYEEVIQHKNSEDSALAVEAHRAGITMMRSGKIDRHNPSLSTLLARPADPEQLQA